ncbi:tyrosine-type recombinase/integrase [Paraburkholderia caribensis]|uniref:tyrosine-type recombinase/integrase n=1 Tax=Paraburkholderia caribensis TaxID=75105 RepID=UPI0020909E32|nr:tyrosine-type recombinase/integrase [Paraburkholderia caribensis]MCO4880224.1 tyrosine-type recombinase/integrase [Paraburkholderia caribensis]
MAKENIRTKTARAKLKAEREPYWESHGKGVSLGYRKLDSGSGTWIGRRKGPDGRYQFKSFGTDITDAIDYNTAVTMVLGWVAEGASGVEHSTRAKTVADVCSLYVENRRVEKGEKTAYDAEMRFQRFVYPETAPLAKGTKILGRKKKCEAFDNPLGSTEITKLKPIQVESWRNQQLDNIDVDDPESLARAKDTVNRNLKTLKAALNYGKDVLKLVATDLAWKGVVMFPNVGARRNGWLTVDQRKTLIEAMAPELKIFATALLLIGARPGELANANVSDFSKNARTLLLTGKTGRREIPLSAKAIEFFTENTSGRIGNAPLLIMENGERWKAPVWVRLMRDAREKALMPDAVLYCLRHTYISEAIAQGLDVYTVANLTGTSVEIIQSNYGTLTDNIAERLNRLAMI